jgi:SpoVK/Ycf46/Vps4 family AAA+-type ATPase
MGDAETEQRLTTIDELHTSLTAANSLHVVIEAARNDHYRLLADIFGTTRDEILTPSGTDLAALPRSDTLYVPYNDGEIAVIRPTTTRTTGPGRSRQHRRGRQTPTRGVVIGHDDTPVGIFAHTIDVTDLDPAQELDRETIRAAMGFDRELDPWDLPETLDLDAGEQVRVQGDLRVERRGTIDEFPAELARRERIQRYRDGISDVLAAVTLPSQFARGQETDVPASDVVDPVVSPTGSITLNPTTDDLRLKLMTYAKHIVAQLLVLMDGIGAKDNNRTGGRARPATDSRDLKVIASTNRPDALDAALLRPGRFGNRPVTFEAPGAEAAEKILHFYLEQVRSRTELSLSGDLEAFVARGESAEVHRFTQNHLTGLTGAEIEGLVGEATRMTRRRKEPNSASDLTLTTLEQSYETGPYTADYADRPIDADPTTTVDPGVLEQLENSLVAYSETHSDAPRDILKAYAEWIEPDTVLYRSIDARILIGDSTVDTTAYITSRLTPPDQSAVCVVLQNTDRLIHAASQGVPSAKQALTITNEQIATWNKSNLLITEDVGEVKRDWFLSIYETDIYKSTRE